VRRIVFVSALTCAAVFLIGCPKNVANQDYKAGRKSEAVQDYDTALVDYERALRAEPTNAEYKLRVFQMRLQAGQYHVELGLRAFDKGDLQLALSEFQKAQGIDPSNQAAQQGAKRTMQALAAKAAAAAPKAAPNAEAEGFQPTPPELKPLSNEPINLKMTNDSRVVFETIAKLAGLSVIFDPDFTSRRIPVELPNVTLEQALDDVALESKAFWKPLSSSVIFVAPDNPQKRRDVEDEEVQTFYLSNTVTPQEITEIVTGLRQLLDLRRLSQVNAQNAIVIRDTPDKLALASKIISDIDKARPEVLVHVQVLAASVDRLRDLGILPGQSVTVTFTPECALQPTSSGCTTSSTTTTTSTTTTPAQVTLSNLKNLSGNDWSVTMPGAVATAIMNDNKTKLIQDPEIRVSDGEKATLTVGEKVPIATGSFQAGVGVGVGGGAGVVNPLVNTQFQYLDVGVKVDVTPRIHPDGDVSMKLSVEISALNGTSNIGGINQPIISTRKVEHDIRLKDGEASVLGGLIEQIDTKTANGWPGLGEVPGLKYLFSEQTHELQEDEVLIVLTPHIVRLPAITAENLRTIAAGTDTNARVYHDDDQGSATPAIPGPATAPPNAPTTQASPQPNQTPTAQLHFDPARTILKAGDSTTLGLAVSNVNDLFSIPLLVKYDPAVVQVEDVRDGGFLSGGEQGIAIVHSIDQAHGQVIISATRRPSTPGVNGSGTLLGIVIRGLAPGNTTLQILQVNARDSQQRTLPMVSSEAAIQVQ
jgi:general secretion pathway protein D